MNKYKIWIVEDRLAVPITKALDALVGDYAEPNVFTDPAEAIEELEKAESPNELPDIVLIDVDFGARSSRGPIATVKSNVRGFVVAAELKHYTTLLGKRDFAYRIYTGNKTVRDDFQWLYKNPFGPEGNKHEGLLPISEKAEVGGTFDVLRWIREETYVLSEKRLRYAEKDLSMAMEQLGDNKIELEEAWFQVWQSCRDDFESSIRPEIERTLETWAQMLKQDEELSRKQAIPETRLKAARSSGAVLYALTLVQGSNANQLVTEIRKAAKEFGLRHATELVASRQACYEVTESILRIREFEKIIGLLYPFEAQEIKKSSDMETIIGAVRRILRFIGKAIDHNYTLVRAFKSLKLAGEGESIPTTVFAHACHSWVPEWSFPIPKPQNDEERESLLRKEVGLEPLSSDDQYISLLSIPAKALDRIQQDGRAIGSPPLVSFGYGDQAHWIEFPWVYIARILIDNPPASAQEKLRGIKVNFDQEEYRGLRVATDWRHVFDPEDGLLFKILREEKPIARLKKVDIKYGPRAETLTIRFSFELNEYYGPLDLTESRGGLVRKLKRFLGWGQLTIYSNTRNARYRTLWPGGKPEDWSENPATSELTIEWQIRNYVKTRGGE